MIHGNVPASNSKPALANVPPSFVAMAEKSRGGSCHGPTRTTSSSGPSDPASWSVGTTIDATSVTTRCVATAMAKPPNRASG